MKKRSIKQLTLLGHSTTRYPDSPVRAKLEAFPNAYSKRN